MKNLMGLIILLVMFSTNVSQAQVIRNASEASTNRKAIKTGEQQLEKDIAQLAAFKTKVEAFKTAFYAENLDKVVALKGDIVTDMKREIEQSERKIAQDKQELSQSQAEVRSSNREVRSSRRDLNNRDGDLGERRDLKDDRRDKRDDQRDARDDQTDLQVQIARTMRQKEILNTLQAFTYSLAPTAKEKAIANMKLMNEFINTLEADIATTKAELAEDKREMSEDRRERREDKRERRERIRNF
ncbi:MAG: hypothetical protein AAFO07_22935 [Bacteroidota bacterium]